MSCKVYGRRYSCLLATLFLILPPATLRAQSDSSNPARDFALPIIPPHQPPITGMGAPLRPPIVSPVAPPIVSPVAPPGAPPRTIGLMQLTQAAGTIFSGTVTNIVPRPATNGQAIETVAITFHVERAIRGVTPGEDFTISQWIGLWSGGQRYRVGDRLLLFLYPPSKLGLTSCVGAALGRFTTDRWGGVLFSAQHLSAFQSDPVLGGKSRVMFGDFAQAVRQAQSRAREE